MLSTLRSCFRKGLAVVGCVLGNCTIQFWRRPSGDELPVSVHMLVSSSSWHCGLLAAISLEFHSKRRWRFFIHEDGTVTPLQRRIIEKTLPEVRFVARPEAEERMRGYLEKFPRCLAHRAKHNFFLKFFDVRPFAPYSKFLLLDSDVIFFKCPNEILEWADSAGEGVFYNEDTQEKYCSPRQELEGVFKFPIWPRFNSGLVLMQSAAINLPLAEKLLEDFETTAHHPQFFEQTLYCLMGSAWGKGGALPRKYEINWGYFRSPGAVCRHYVGAFKHDLLYIEGASVLFIQLVTSFAKKNLQRVFLTRRWILAFFVSCLILLAFGSIAGRYFYTLNGIPFFSLTPFKAVQERSGLPETMKKLQSGLPVVVGYLGGSITQNAEPEGYVTSLRNHLLARFSNARVRTINAGMASTDSAWGSKRIDRDLLCEKPDLVFVEFAVNDGQRDSAVDMERIVQKIYHANRETEIVFIYTTSDSAFKKLSQGKLPHAIVEHEKVANKFGIPSITFGSDLYLKIRSGKWFWKDFFQDACHPTQTGYESYNRDFLPAVDGLLKTSAFKPKELITNIFQDCELRPTLHVPIIEHPVVVTDWQGRTFRGADFMPIFGKEWAVNSKLTTQSGSEWRLEYAIFDRMPEKASNQAMTKEWSAARWFEEGGGFTGKRSRLLAESGSVSGSKLKIAPYLSGGSVELPQVVWCPAKSGECLFEIFVSKIQGYVNGPPASAGLEVFLCNSLGEPIKSLASIVGGDGESLHLQKSLRFDHGDTILVRPFAKGYEFLEFDGVEIKAGFLDTPPST